MNNANKKDYKQFIIGVFAVLLLIASLCFLVKNNVNSEDKYESTSLIEQKDFLYGDSYLNDEKTSAYTVLLMTSNYEKMKNCTSFQIEGKLNNTSKTLVLDNLLTCDIWFCDRQNWDFCIDYSLDELNKISGYSNTCLFGAMFSGIPLNSTFKMRSIYTFNEETIYSEWWEFDINENTPLARDSQFKATIPNE